MKKFLYIFVLIFLLIALISCDGGGGDNSEDSSDDGNNSVRVFQLNPSNPNESWLLSHGVDLKGNVYTGSYEITFGDITSLDDHTNVIPQITHFVLKSEDIDIDDQSTTYYLGDGTPIKATSSNGESVLPKNFHKVPKTAKIGESGEIISWESEIP